MTNLIGINIDIPKRSLWSILWLVVVTTFSLVLLVTYLMPGFRELFLLELETVSLGSIELIWLPIISFLLAGAIAILGVNIIKPLKPVTRQGLVWTLFWSFALCSAYGSAFGLFGGLLSSLAFGFVTGFFTGFLWLPLFGFLWGLTFGLTFGLVYSLVFGILWEFDD